MHASVLMCCVHCNKYVYGVVYRVKIQAKHKDRQTNALPRYNRPNNKTINIPIKIMFRVRAENASLVRARLAEICTRSHLRERCKLNGCPLNCEVFAHAFRPIYSSTPSPFGCVCIICQTTARRAHNSDTRPQKWSDRERTYACLIAFKWSARAETFRVECRVHTIHNTYSIHHFNHHLPLKEQRS